MRALVLSTGGSKSAYQVGALKHLLGDLKRNYDIFCGVSAGAITCAFLSMFSPGHEQQSILELIEFWKSIDQSQIFQNWRPLGRIHALWKKSLYDSSPLHNLIKNKISLDRVRDSGKKISVGAVSLSSGKYTIFNQDSEYFIEAIIASSSLPGLFTPVEFLGQLWSDGGIKQTSPINTAIDLGADYIDIILTSPQTRVKKFIENPSIIDIIRRCFELSSEKIMSNDLEKIEMHNILAKNGVPNKKFIEVNVIRPSINLTEDLLDFSPDKIQEMMNQGYKDAKLYRNNII